MERKISEGLESLVRSALYSKSTTELNLSNGGDLPEGYALDSEIDAVKAVLNIFQRQAFERMARLGRRRNAIVPRISRLPDETLTDIMRLSLIEANPHHSENQDFHRLSLQLVSHRWYQIVSNHPRFWTELFPSKGISATLALLRRSKNASLDIHTTTMTSLFFETVLPHIHRFRFLSLQISPQDDTSLFMQSMPMLERLSLTAEYRLITSPEILANAPRLVSLQLKNVIIPSTCNIYKNITDLSIYHRRAFLGAHHDLSRGADLHRLLHACPRLKTLHLSLPYIESLDDANLQEYSIHLPSLISIEVNMTIPVLQFLFQAIQAPNCSTVRVHRVREGLLQAALNTPLLRSILPSFSRHVGFVISREWSDQDLVSFEGGTQTIHLQAPAYGGWIGMSVLAWHLRTMNRAVSSCSLTLDLSWTEAATAIRWLCGPTNAEVDGRTTWAFPRLTHLRIVGENVPIKDIVDLVRTRSSSQGVEYDDSVDAYVPRHGAVLPLEKIIIDSPDGDKRRLNILGKDWLDL